MPKLTPLLIKVTRAHIKAAQATRAEYPRSVLCPVARALQAAGFPQARAGGYAALLNGAEMDGHGSNLKAKFPPGVSRYVRDFDEGVVVKPFSFTIKLTPEAVALRKRSARA